MRIVFFGTPQFAVPSLERFLAHPDFEVIGVVTQPDKRRGRGGQVMPSPVKQVALNADCRLWQPQRIKKDEAVLTDLEAAGADAFVVIAYGQILSPRILAMPRLGCINAHGSLLPAYRGAAPIQWSLYHGESETGVTTMLMDAGMDTGPMLLKSRLPIDLMATAQDLAQVLAAQSADLLVDTLQQLQLGSVAAVSQPEEQATYAPLIQKEDYALDWSRSAIALHNQIRGFYPNCTTLFRSEPLKITATAPLEEFTWPQLPENLIRLQSTVEAIQLTAASARPGEVVGLLKGQGPLIQTGEGLLLLLQVQPQGKRPQTGADFVNGSRLEISEQLGQ
ncbi:MAG: methionyl-tRNA formyltransferase [Cyanobacteria bacterium Co-bin13]|nr:methionyl-tRNA formyltransferase [Cyanobacteria bacterium Co-bin13]